MSSAPRNDCRPRMPQFVDNLNVKVRGRVDCLHSADRGGVAQRLPGLLLVAGSSSRALDMCASARAQNSRCVRARLSRDKANIQL